MISSTFFCCLAVLLLTHAKNANACQDTVSSSSIVGITDPISGLHQNFTSCAALISSYVILCTAQYGYGDADGRCCQTCQQQNLDCIDNTLLYITTDDGRKGCSDIAVTYPHWCESQNIATGCCQSCSQRPVCSDYLDENSAVNVYDSNDVFIESVITCDRLVTAYPQFCSTYGVDGQRCCDSCQSVNLQCFDSLTSSTAITVTHADNTQTVISDCNTLVTQFLYLCEKGPGQNGGQCCDSCSQQDLTCYDDTSVTWSGQKCAEYVAGDVCRCQTVGQTCCASCTGKDTSSCACRDYLSASTAITFSTSNSEPVETVTSCARLVDAYRHTCVTYGQSGGKCCESCSNVNTVCYDYMSPVSTITVTHIDGSKTVLDDCNKLIDPQFLYLCKGSAGQDGGRCCDLCSQQDLTCIDDNSRYFGSPAQQCADYVAADPCRCLDVSGLASTCCASCSGLDTSYCGCRDKLSPTSTITIRTTTSSGTTSTVVDNCQTIVDSYQHLCAKGPQDLGKDGDVCCDSCKNICVDSRTFTMSVSRKGKSCTDCTCAQILAKGNRLMKKACRNGAQEACCATCESLLT